MNDPCEWATRRAGPAKRLGSPPGASPPAFLFAAASAPAQIALISRAGQIVTTARDRALEQVSFIQMLKRC